MKPAPFEYFAPTTLSEALDILHQHGGDAKVLAGGQSLVPLLSFRLVKPGAVVDINNIADLAYIRPADGAIQIGALTRQSDVLASDAVRRACPLLSHAMSLVGHPATRNRGTLCGSLAHADPAAEPAAVATVLNADLVVQSSRGRRVLKPDQFFVSYFTTALEPDEIVTEVRYPALGARTGWEFLEVSRRHGDFAVVAVAVVVTLGERNSIQGASVVLGGVGGTPVRARAVEEALVNSNATDDSLAKAAELVKAEIEPETDIHASATYRKDVAAVLVRRALQSAARRARA